MREKDEGIAAVLEYATSLFDEATVRRIGGYLQTMLAAIVEDEGQEIGAVRLLSAQERGLASMASAALRLALSRRSRPSRQAPFQPTIVGRHEDFGSR